MARHTLPAARRRSHARLGRGPVVQCAQLHQQRNTLLPSAWRLSKGPQPGRRPPRQPVAARPLGGRRRCTSRFNVVVPPLDQPITPMRCTSTPGCAASHTRQRAHPARDRSRPECGRGSGFGTRHAARAIRNCRASARHSLRHAASRRFPCSGKTAHPSWHTDHHSHAAPARPAVRTQWHALMAGAQATNGHAARRRKAKATHLLQHYRRLSGRLGPCSTSAGTGQGQRGEGLAGEEVGGKRHGTQVNAQQGLGTRSYPEIRKRRAATLAGNAVKRSAHLHHAEGTAQSPPCPPPW